MSGYTTPSNDLPQQPAIAQLEGADEYTLLLDAAHAPAPRPRRRWLLTLVAAPVPQVPAQPELPYSFAPNVLQGTRSTVQPFAIPATGAGHAILTAESTGSSNFVVWTMPTPRRPTSWRSTRSGPTADPSW